MTKRRRDAADERAKRPPIAGVEIVKRTPMDPQRRAELERLLQDLLDKYGTSDGAARVAREVR